MRDMTPPEGRTVNGNLPPGGDVECASGEWTLGDRYRAPPPFVGNFVELKTIQHRDDSAPELPPMGGFRADRKRLLLQKIQISGRSHR